MALQFKNIWLLLLIIPAAIFIYYTTKNMVRLVKWRKLTIILLRGLILLMVILLLAGFSIRQTADISTTFFLMDASDSIRDKGMEEQFIIDSLKYKGRNDEIGVISFAENSSVEFLPSSKPIFTELQSRVNTAYTNIENSLIMAQSIMPWDHQKRIVLLTDGLENTGDALKQVKLMQRKGYEIDVVGFNSDVDDEVQINEVKVPDSVNINEQFELTVEVQSNVKTDAILFLYSDRRLTAQKEVSLSKGNNRFAFSDKAVNGGTATYRVEIQADRDTVVENNGLSSFTYVKDIPEILLLQENDSAGKELEAILRDDLSVTVLSPKQVSDELSELLKYDAFILANVSADSLSDKFLNNLETAVAHQGKGLLVTGGDNSYGPGGYYKTVLEKILPVNMDIKPKEEEPNLALMLVIDKSGSMSSGDYGIAKMELAKEAAIRATEVLKPDDMIGVIAFDDALKWVVKPQKNDDLIAIQDAIGTIRAGGGTQILPSLEEAYYSIKELNTKLKHIILLTDGQAEKYGYEPVIEGLRENGITLSTVAVGRGADQLLMQALAYGGQGRYYQTDEFTDIPKIFTKEVFLAGKKYLTNRTFIPLLNSQSEILKGIDAIPQLDGYVTTTPKKTAQVIFTSDENDPVLSSWQYGLGRTVAWTPDAQGVWTYDWMNWNESPRFWKNILSWLVQQDLSKGYTVESGFDGKDGIITIKAEEESFMTANDVKGTITGPDGDMEIILNPTSPGEYMGRFLCPESGVYIADITLTGSDGREERISSGIAMPYSPEYDLLSDESNGLLQRLVYEGGGRLLNNPSEVFESELPPVTGLIDPTFPMIIALFILFLADIVLRRLNLNFKAVGDVIKIAADAGSRAAGSIAAPIREVQFKRKNKKEKEKAELPSDIEQKTERREKEIKNPAENAMKSSDSHIAALLEKKKKWNR